MEMRLIRHLTLVDETPHTSIALISGSFSRASLIIQVPSSEFYSMPPRALVFETETQEPLS